MKNFNPEWILVVIVVFLVANQRKMTEFVAEWILIVKKSVFVYGKYPSEKRCYYKRIINEDNLKELGINRVPLVEIYSDDLKYDLSFDLSSIRCKELRHILLRPQYVNCKWSSKRYADYYKEDTSEYNFSNPKLPTWDNMPYIRYIEHDIGVTSLHISPVTASDGKKEDTAAWYMGNTGFVFQAKNEYEKNLDSTNKYIPEVFFFSCDYTSDDFSWVLCDELHYEMTVDKPLDISCPSLPSCVRMNVAAFRFIGERDELTIKNSTGKVFELIKELTVHSERKFADPNWQNWFPNLVCISSMVTPGIYHPGCKNYTIKGSGTRDQVIGCFRNIMQISPGPKIIMFVDLCDVHVVFQLAREMLIGNYEVNAHVGIIPLRIARMNEVCERIRMIAQFAHLFGADAAKEIMSYKGYPLFFDLDLD